VIARAGAWFAFHDRMTGSSDLYTLARLHGLLDSVVEIESMIADLRGPAAARSVGQLATLASTMREVLRSLLRPDPTPVGSAAPR
jgi:hypothetical protein